MAAPPQNVGPSQNVGHHPMPPAPLQQIDPDLQAIFDHLASYMGTEYSSMTATLTFDGLGVRQIATATLVNSINNWQYMMYVAGNRVSVSPINTTLGSGQSQQFTASATDADGTNLPSATFVWSVGAGSQGSIDQTGLYEAPPAATAGNDIVRCTLSGQMSWTTVTVILHP